MVNIYKANQNVTFNSYSLHSYNLHNETKMWYLNGIRTYHNNIPILWAIASSSSKEELLVWADMNSIKIDYEK